MSGNIVVVKLYKKKLKNDMLLLEFHDPLD